MREKIKLAESKYFRAFPWGTQLLFKNIAESYKKCPKGAKKRSKIEKI